MVLPQVLAPNLMLGGELTNLFLGQDVIKKNPSFTPLYRHRVSLHPRNRNIEHLFYNHNTVCNFSEAYFAMSLSQTQSESYLGLRTGKKQWPVLSQQIISFTNRAPIQGLDPQTLPTVLEKVKAAIVLAETKDIG